MSKILNYSSFDTIQDSVDHVRQIFFTGKKKKSYFANKLLYQLYIKANLEKCGFERCNLKDSIH